MTETENLNHSTRNLYNQIQAKTFPATLDGQVERMIHLCNSARTMREHMEDLVQEIYTACVNMMQHGAGKSRARRAALVCTLSDELYVYSSVADRLETDIQLILNGLKDCRPKGAK